MRVQDMGRHVGDRVVIVRRGHPWEGFSGEIDELIADNPYIQFGVRLDNGMRAGCSSSDVQAVREPSRRGGEGR